MVSMIISPGNLILKDGGSPVGPVVSKHHQREKERKKIKREKSGVRHESVKNLK